MIILGVYNSLYCCTRHNKGYNMYYYYLLFIIYYIVIVTHYYNQQLKLKHYEGTYNEKRKGCANDI